MNRKGGAKFIEKYMRSVSWHRNPPFWGAERSQQAKNALCTATMGGNAKSVSARAGRREGASFHDGQLRVRRGPNPGQHFYKAGPARNTCPW